MNENIALPEDRIADFCRRHHIKKLSVFGSALRGDFAPDSDVDVLYWVGCTSALEDRSTRVARAIAKVLKIVLQMIGHYLVQVLSVGEEHRDYRDSIAVEHEAGEIRLLNGSRPLILDDEHDPHIIWRLLGRHVRFIHKADGLDCTTPSQRKQRSNEQGRDHCCN